MALWYNSTQITETRINNTFKIMKNTHSKADKKPTKIKKF